MKNWNYKTWGAIVLFLSGLALPIYAIAYLQDTFISATDAEKKWGLKKLDAQSFKQGTAEIRAPMAVDIVKKKIFVGKDMLNVKKQLGDPNSYFFSDTIFAYQIQTSSEKNQEVWHLVFIPDQQLQKVKEVKIHKKCCYDTSVLEKLIK